MSATRVETVTVEADKGLTPWRAGVLIVVVGLLVYANSFTKAFVYDDHHWIDANPLIRDPGAYIASWPSRALVAVSIQLNFFLGKLNPAGYHLFNLFVHLAAALTLFGLVRRTLLLPYFAGRFRETATGYALAVALVWTVHPVATHAVTYIIQRCESMMSLFYLLTLYCFVRGATATGRSWGWYAASLLAALLGAFCKEIILSVPLTVLAYDWTFIDESWRARLRRRGWVYAGLILVAGIPLYIHLPGLREADAHEAVGFSAGGMTPFTYLMTEAGVIIHYLRLAVVPDPLSLDYRDWPIVRSFSGFIVPGMVVGSLFLASLWGLWRRHWLGFVGISFFLVLSVSSSFLPIIDVANDYRMYLPVAAVVVIGIFGIGYLLSKALDAAGRSSWRRAVSVGLVALVCGALGWLTLRRNEDYRSGLTIWQSALRSRPDNLNAQIEVASGYLRQEQYEKARELYEQFLVAKIESQLLYVNLGRVYWELGVVDKAEQILRLAGSLPDAANPHRRYYFLSVLLAATDRRAEALSLLEEGIAKYPDQVLLRYLEAGILLETGDDTRARKTLREADRTGSVAQLAAISFAVPALRAARPDRPLLVKEAVFLFRATAAARDNRDPESLDLLAAAYAVDGRFLEAVETAEKGVRAAQELVQPYWEKRLNHRLQLYREGRTPYQAELKSP